MSALLELKSRLLLPGEEIEEIDLDPGEAGMLNQGGMGGAAPIGGAQNSGGAGNSGSFPGGGASGAGTGTTGNTAFNGGGGGGGLVVVRWSSQYANSRDRLLDPLAWPPR